jgi:hypothetical protein
MHRSSEETYEAISCLCTAIHSFTQFLCVKHKVLFIAWSLVIFVRSKIAVHAVLQICAKLAGYAGTRTVSNNFVSDYRRPKSNLVENEKERG